MKTAIAWDAPARWQRHVPSSPLRTAEYQVPRAPGDTEDAECTIVTFGPGQGGGIDGNVERWVEQFGGAQPSRTTRAVRGMNVTRVELAGTYTAMRRPDMRDAPEHSGWRMIGAIVESPGGYWFFKLTGPDATVKAASTEFDAVVDSCHVTTN